MTNSDDFETIEAFGQSLKQWRGKGWIFYSGSVAGMEVRLKTYNHTYMQIFSVDGMNCRLSPMDCKVSDFNAAINEGLNQ